MNFNRLRERSKDQEAIYTIPAFFSLVEKNLLKNKKMIIGVAGPYSADTAGKRKANLDVMNNAAARLLEMGHIPLIGINAALPVLEKANVSDRYKGIMDISLAVISACDALLVLAESPGANKERDLILSMGKPVYATIEEIENRSLNNEN